MVRDELAATLGGALPPAAPVQDVHPRDTELPPAYAVRQLLERLLSRRVTVAPDRAWIPAATEAAAFGVYSDGPARQPWVVVCDLRLAAGAGAAVGLLPPIVAQHAIASGTRSDALVHNLP